MSARQAEIHALRVAQEAAAHVPAYARFLRLAGYDASRLRSFAEFCALPTMDKCSYLARYSLEQRCRRGDLARAHIVTLSSGSSGQPVLWPRFPEQDAVLQAGLMAMLQEHFRIRERWTLLVVTLAMGSWVAGTLIAELGQRIFAQPGLRGTVVTPGLNQEEALRFVEQLSPHYDQTLVIGYPAPLANLLEDGEQRGLTWPDLNVHVITGGEYVSEGQRERILARIGKDPERLEGFVVLFASSEVAGALGYETHLCLLIRRLCARSPALTQALFGSTVIPSLNQYNPLNYFLQVENDELLLTTRGAVSLVRYNTHDRGGLLTLDEMLARCRAQGFDLRAELRARGFGPEALQPLPFVHVFGRSDAAIVHGANVYVEQVRQVLDGPGLPAFTTGRFQLEGLTDPDGRSILRVEVELRAEIEASAELCASYQQAILQGLQQVNSEFRVAYEAARGRIAVHVALLPFGTFRQTTGKHQYLARDCSTAPPRAATNGGHATG
jgi:phenylacetate-CoA ligase